MGMAHHRKGPNDFIESLGLQTYGKERTDPNYIARKPTFKHKAVNALYKVELQALFGRLHRDGLDRSDPDLFSEELDELLAEYGPLIWPEPGHGKRDHLREPQEDTKYPRDLVYPRDSAILKKFLRSLVVSKKPRSEIDLLNSYINKTHKDAQLYGFASGERLSMEIPLRRRESSRSTETTDNQTIFGGTISNASEMDISSDESEDSIVGTKTPSQASNWSSDSRDPPFKIELRLYRSRKRAMPIGSGATWYYRDVMFTDRIKSCEDFFLLICDTIEADCSFIIFHLPEDMSREGRVRIDRGRKESDVVFLHTRYILQRARRFPGGPLHRSVELEVGLGTD